MRARSQRGLGSARLGMLLWTVGLLAVAVVFLLPLVRHSGFELRGTLTHGANVKAGVPVRIAGITVGRVESLTPAPAGTSVVTMRLSDDALPIHADATVTVRQRLLLEGSVFIELSAGSPSAPTLSSGATLPREQASASVQADQTFTGLQSHTRRQLQVLLRDLARGLQRGGAEGFNRSIPYWESAYRDAAVVARAWLGSRPGDLSSLVRDGGRTAAAFARDTVALRNLIRGANSTAAGFARHDGALAAAVHELPRTLLGALPALREVDASLPAFRQMVAEMRPAIHSAPPALKAMTAALRQVEALMRRSELDGLTAAMRPAVPALTRLSRDAVPVLEGVSEEAGCQNRVILPWSTSTVPDEFLPAAGPVYVEGAKVAAGAGGESVEQTASGQHVRVMLKASNFATLLGDGRFLLTTSPMLGVNPRPPAEPPGLHPDVPCETQAPPDLRSTPSSPPEQRRVTVDDLGVLDHYVERTVDRITGIGGPGVARAISRVRSLMAPGNGWVVTEGAGR